MMQSLEPILATHPFFKDLDKPYLELLTGCASNVRFEAGEYILHQGDEANNFYIIRHGNVALEMLVPGRGPITIETVGEGEVLGWSWLFPPHHWRFDARAIELTRAIALDGVCLREKCEADHNLGYELMKRFAEIVTQRLQATRLQLLDVYNVRS
jgi:CRP/FNR family transcriptional regulator, cyclic AMP receptor protein